MKVLDKESAILEVEKWLDFKKVRQSKREQRKEDIENIVECFEEGIFSMDDDFNITQNLAWPIGGGINKIVFKPRMNGKDFQKYANKLASGDTQGFVNAKIAALTGQNTSIINELDHEDASVSNYIAIFFVA